jgi:hypothetical protein
MNILNLTNKFIDFQAIWGIFLIITGGNIFLDWKFLLLKPTYLYNLATNILHPESNDS